MILGSWSVAGFGGVPVVGEGRWLIGGGWRGRTDSLQLERQPRG